MSAPTDRKLRIAFAITGGAGWIAGIHYFANLLHGIRSIVDSDLCEIALIASADHSKTDLEPLLAYRASIVQPFARYAPANAPGVAQEPAACARRSIPIRVMSRVKRLFGVSPDSPRCARATVANETGLPAPIYGIDKLAQFLQQQHFHAIFASGEFGADFPVPLLAWIPDFQHKDLPQFFSQQELVDRDGQFERMFNNAQIVILSSEHAASVARRHYSEDQCKKIRVLPFVAQIPFSVFVQKPTALVEKYKLPERFFFLPNQFWKHKNHEVVIDALALLKNSAPDVHVVCSGSTKDYRDADYFPSLQAKILDLGVDKNIHILGMIPELDVFGLMRQSLAVLQPSLYEGWSTTVEQAKSLGKAMVLSDLAVHREQNPPQTVYFQPSDAAQLAELLLKEFNEREPGPDLRLEAHAASNLKTRTLDFGKQFLDIAAEVAPKDCLALM